MNNFFTVLKERTIKHTHQDEQLESVLVTPDGSGPFPAVLLIHEYTGLNKVTLDHARRLARAGYTVLAADFYGPDKIPNNIDEARVIHRIYRDDRLLMRKRAQACLEVLINQPETNSAKITALGFSFGGGAVLELARCNIQLNKHDEQLAGTINGAISVYGYLDTTHPAAHGQIKAKLLALHVENDPVVPEKHAEMFVKEMNEVKADWSMIRIQNAKHGFANPDDTAFDPILAEKAWGIILDTFKKWL
ncbi:dienelactone hydrolase family protein [Maridesulfovibrio ferrireducens]|nr:dienelactone hydrolase family protein [Maridesulfovibrio ferrireducens]